ncbi:hypothetical protein PPACK8108_LOCUS21440 [Phakopsora pachyrhizi]|uniref:Uncharacterized protein n=1 Tax=Phakopsora pachyrhizi TaxID=170000 RepID=A0AAV0BJK4_PHAPC|nr:hypothetical protein PPACK8108_LOCUS21440 [Phakopsora pachyrhizi]
MKSEGEEDEQSGSWDKVDAGYDYRRDDGTGGGAVRGGWLNSSLHLRGPKEDSWAQGNIIRDLDKVVIVWGDRGNKGNPVAHGDLQLQQVNWARWLRRLWESRGEVGIDDRVVGCIPRLEDGLGLLRAKEWGIVSMKTTERLKRERICRGRGIKAGFQRGKTRMTATGAHDQTQIMMETIARLMMATGAHDQTQIMMETIARLEVIILVGQEPKKVLVLEMFNRWREPSQVRDV